MGEPLRNVEHSTIVGRQNYRKKFFVCWGLRTEIYDHVVDRSPGTTYDSCFRSRSNLIMHPPQSTPQPIVGDIALNQSSVQTIRGKLLYTVTPCKEPSFVLQPIHLDNKGPLQSRLLKNHDRTFTSGIGTTNFPPHAPMKAICCMTSSRIFHGRMRT